MARSRTLRPGFFTSFTLAQVSRDCRLFFGGLWVEADDEGRLIDSPKMLAGAIFPHDDDVTVKVANGWLDDLVGIEAIVRYETEGGRYIVISNFGDHQKPPHATPSKLPAPPLTSTGADAREPRENSRAPRENEGDSTGNAALGLGLGLGSGLGLLSTAPAGGGDGEVLAPGAGFDEFWSAYPRKVGKPSALKAWKRIKPVDHEPVAAGVSRWADYWQASRTRLEHIPHPATWLNDRRWENQPPPTHTGPTTGVDVIAQYRQRNGLGDERAVS
jgi:hypothetical protein